MTVPVTVILEQQAVLQQQIAQSEQNLAAQQSSLMQTEAVLIDDIIRKYQSELLTQVCIHKYR